MIDLYSASEAYLRVCPDLQMGVHQMGLRDQLLKNIETTKEEMERAKLKAKELEVSHSNGYIEV